MKYGLSRPSSLSFNSRRYNEGKCEYWQYAFYSSWYGHARQNKVVDKFKNFEVAYKWLTEECTQFQQYKNLCTSGDYCWETDLSGGFGPNMVYTTKKRNGQLRVLMGNGDLVKASHTKEACDKRSASVGNPVKAIAPCGKEFLFDSANDCAKFLGYQTSGGIDYYLKNAKPLGKNSKAPGWFISF